MSLRTIIWSYSALDMYRTCKQKFFRKYIRKDKKDSPGPEAQHGIRVHSQLEKLVKGDGYAPDAPEHARRVAIRLRDLGAQAELELAVTRDWEPCGFWGEDCYGRGKLDNVLLSSDGKSAGLIDWKTGKPSNMKYMDEFELICQTVLLTSMYPSLKSIRAHYYYTQNGATWAGKDANDRYRLNYHFTDFKDYRAVIDRMVAEIENREEDKFTPRKNPLCAGYCPVNDCKHWRKEPNKRYG